MRMTIQNAIPEAKEIISYGMPAYKQHGVLVYFDGYKNYISLHPTGAGVAAFKNELGAYKHSKGTIQFALDQPLPFDLIEQIVRFRAIDDQERAKNKTKKK